MYSAGLVVFWIIICGDDLTTMRYIDSVNIGRELIAIAAEMFNSETFVVLLPVHGYRNDTSLVPISNMPRAGTANRNTAAQRKILGIVIDHFKVFLGELRIEIEE